MYMATHVEYLDNILDFLQPSFSTLDKDSPTRNASGKYFITTPSQPPGSFSNASSFEAQKSY